MAVGLGVWEERERVSRVVGEGRKREERWERKDKKNIIIIIIIIIYKKKLRIEWLLSKKYHM